MLRARFIVFLLYLSRSCLKGSLSLISSAFFSLCSLLSFVINTILLASSPRLNISLLSDLSFLICLPIIVSFPTFLTVPTFLPEVWAIELGRRETLERFSRVALSRRYRYVGRTELNFS